jgi:fumarate reductase flavoprotein subunit
MYIADDATSWHQHADLAIVGSGAGALVAAIVAARQGRHVVVHERAKDLGGSLARGPGMIPAAGTRLQRAAGVIDGPEAFASDLLGPARDPCDPALAVAACRAAAELVDWLVDEGTTRLAFVPSIVARSHTAPRLHAHAQGTGAELCADLIQAASREPHVSLRTASVVEDLWTDPSGAVVGVAARERRGPINVAARRVLLACGGFAASADLLAAHQPDVVDLPYVGVAGALGDGLRWAMAGGGATRNLGSCWVTPFAVTPGGYVVPDSLVREGGVLVNQKGERFVDESASPIPVARAILSQPGRVAYLLFDERIYRATRETDPHFARLIVPRAVRRGASVADVARHFELDVDALVATLETFHPRAASGADPFGRAPSAAPLTPPYHAVRVGAARVRTLGGLLVDTAGRVLRADGTPIVNLHAAGGVAADLCGDGSSAYPIGHDALTSMALGWLGAHAPETKPGAGVTPSG